MIAPLHEVQEVRNAIKAYEQFEHWQPTDETHLLNAHQLLMSGLIDHAGRYRTGNVGVMKGEQVIHIAPPANCVKKLMVELLNWLSISEQHPLIISSVFHYEFEFIHPFADGNGRMGRLWQSLILSQWQPLLAQLPVESMIYDYQKEYYQAINQSTAETDSAPFIHFMLTIILQTIANNTSYPLSPQVKPQVSPQVDLLLEVLKISGNKAMSRDELQSTLNLKDRKSFRKHYLKPALDAGLIEMTLPDKPNSPLQCYQLKNYSGIIFSA